MRRVDPLPRLTMRRSGSIGLNVAAHSALGRPERVALLYDPDERIVGLKAAPSDDGAAFKVSNTGSVSAPTLHVSAIGFFDHCGLWPSVTTAFRATMTDDILHADVTELFEVLAA